MPEAPAPSWGVFSRRRYGLVFTVLSFAGFEGVATLGEEVMNPRRSIPIAIAGTVILAGAFFVIVSYAQVIGYGLDQMEMLANASAPLNDLAIKYVSTDFATAIDLAVAVSAFASRSSPTASRQRCAMLRRSAGLQYRNRGVPSACAAR